MNTSDKLAWNSAAGEEAQRSGPTKTTSFVPAHVTIISLFDKLFILDHMTTLMIEIPHET